MKQVFISYRRQDDMARAGRVADFLTDHLHGVDVFMDVHGIQPGEDFTKKIADTLSECSVFVPIIGPRWLSTRRRGQRRLFLANDFVRIEVLVAIHRSIPIMPVLVGGAEMPTEGSLPAAISALARRQAIEVSDRDFRDQATGLAEAIRNALRDESAKPQPDLQAESACVAQLIATDIGEYKRRDRRRFLALSGSGLTVAAAAGVWRFREPLRSLFGSVPISSEPRFAQSTVTPDEIEFKVPHPNDTEAWRIVVENKDLRPQSFPGAPKRVREPRLALKDVLGLRASNVVKAIEAAGKIVFHSVGSTGNATRPNNMHIVPAAMGKDFGPANRGVKPSFLFLLGDMILNFGEGKYYYDQFYEPFRNYPAPILAIAGNHDGIVAVGSATRTLDAFLDNFCTAGFHKTDDALDLDRTAQIQPGVYFAFEAPFVRILGLYSNILELQGIISSNGAAELSNIQLDFLEAALTRIRDEHFAGAVIIAVHHNIYTAGPRILSSQMASDLDGVFNSTGVWPHAALSGHAHNYQRCTRTVNGMMIPYVGAGTGGSNIARLSGEPQMGSIREDVVLNHYAPELGFLRISVDRKNLRIEFQPAAEGSTSADSVTVDLQARKVVRPEC